TRLNRRCSWAERPGVGRRPSSDRAHAGGKRWQQRQPRPSIFRHHTAAWAGDKELALQQLEAGLRAPVASLMLSYGTLTMLPSWDPLRGDPRFEKIVASLPPKEPPK